MVDGDNNLKTNNTGEMGEDGSLEEIIITNADIQKDGMEELVAGQANTAEPESKEDQAHEDGNVEESTKKNEADTRVPENFEEIQQDLPTTTESNLEVTTTISEIEGFSSEEKDNTVVEPGSGSEPRKEVSTKRKLELIHNPKDIATKKFKKRITGKMMDKLWSPLSNESYKSVEGIITMCINQTLERYRIPNKGLSKKMIEAQEILNEEWLNKNEDSFTSRLGVTLLPSPDSSGEKDVLNLDKLIRRKKFLETYLLAELKQLHDLERNFRQQEVIYNLDCKYLEDLRRSVNRENNTMRQEINDIREGLSIDISKKSSQHISNLGLSDKREAYTVFNPNKDKDTVQVLTKLKRQLDSMRQSANEYKELDEGLERICHKLI